MRFKARRVWFSKPLMATFATGSMLLSGLQPAAAQTVELSSLSGTDGFAFYGAGGDHFTGREVARAGDFNGDGNEDLLISAPYAGYGGESEKGIVYLVFGNGLIGSGTAGDPLGGGSNLTISSLAANEAIRFVGEDTGDRLGFSVATAGDVNGDGFDDIIMGATGVENILEDDRGRAYIIFGDSEWGAGTTGDPTSGTGFFLVENLTTDNGFYVEGVDDYDFLGYSVDGGDDVNNDGLDDVVIGSLFGSRYGNTAGESMVIFGNTSLGDGTFNDPLFGMVNLDPSLMSRFTGFFMHGENAGDRTGSEVSMIGDIDGDGIGDIGLGAPLADFVNSSSGGVYLVLGNADFSNYSASNPLDGFNFLTLGSAAEQDVFVITNELQNEQIGISVAPAGDVNGDGVDDVIIGSPEASVAGLYGDRHGEAFVIFGSTDFTTNNVNDDVLSGILKPDLLSATELLTVQGVSEIDNLGQSVAGGFDFDDDGIDDIITGAPQYDTNVNNEGLSVLVFGSTNIGDMTGSDPTDDGRSISASNVNGTNGESFGGVDGDILFGGDESGVAVSGFDFNGDGAGDIIIGAALASNNFTRAGEVYVIFGTPAAADSTSPTILTTSSTTPDGSYGQDVVIRIEVLFDEPVIFDTSTNSPDLALNSGGTAEYVSGVGTSLLRFDYTVGPGESTSDLDISSFVVNGLSYTDLAGNAAVLTLPTAGSSLGGSSDIVINTTPPVMTSITSSVSSGTYIVDDVIDLTVTFNEPVTVSTNPLSSFIDLNSSGIALYQSGQGTDTWEFEYTVSEGEAANPLDAFDFSFTSDTLRNAAGNGWDEVLPSGANALSGTKTIIIDAAGPAISRLESTLTAGVYGIGSTIPIRAIYDDNIFLDFSLGEPFLVLNNAGLAAYDQKIGATTLEFDYVVSEGDTIALLDVNNITRNNASIVDGSGIEADYFNLPSGSDTLAQSSMIEIDATRPTVSNTSSPDADTTYNIGDTISIDLTFDENVTLVSPAGTPLRLDLNSGGFAFFDSLLNSTTARFTYTVAEGDATSDLDVTAIDRFVQDLVDGANNSFATSPLPVSPNSLGAQSQIIIDGVRPQISTITATLGDNIYGLNQTFTIDVNFDEGVVINSGSPTLTLSGSGTATFDSQPVPGQLRFEYLVQNGDFQSDLNVLSFNLNGSSITDVADNDIDTALPILSNNLAGQNDVTIDGIDPTSDLDFKHVSNGDVLNTTSVTLTYDFLDDLNVTGFDANNIGDFNVTNGSVLSINSTEQTIVVQPASDGDVTAQILADAATDEAGNGNTASSTVSVTIDTMQPTASISSCEIADGGYTNSFATLNFTANFVDATNLSAFDATNLSQLTPDNATVANGTTKDSSSNFTVTPVSEGLVSVTIPAGAVTDEAGNASTASSTYSFTVSTVRPDSELDSSFAQNAITNSSSFDFEAIFTNGISPYTGFDANTDISVTNGTVNTTGASGFDFFVEPSGDGDVIVQINDGAVTDQAGNTSTVSSTYTIFSDRTDPTVVLSSGEIADGGLTNQLSPFSFTATFTDLTNIGIFDPRTSADMTVANASINNVMRSGNSWTFDVTPNGDGLVSLTVPNNAATDEAGNGNVQSNTYTFTVSTVRPDAIVSSSEITSNELTSSTAVLFEAIFSDGFSPYTGFDALTDLSVINANVSTTGLIDPFEFRLEPINDGIVSVFIEDSAVTDQAGNASTVSPTFSFRYDETRPSVVLTSSDVTSSDTTNVLGPYQIEAVFTDFSMIDDFDPTTPGSLQLTNAVASNVMRSGNTFTFDVTANGDGDVLMTIPENVSFDEVGFGNTTSNQFGFTISTNLPTATLTSSDVADDAVTSNSSVLFLAEFSDGVAPYDTFEPLMSSDVAVTNSNVSISGLIDPLEFRVEPIAEGPVTVRIPTGAVQDQASNPNAASAIYNFVYDATRPSVVLTATGINDSDVTNDEGPYSFEADFTDTTSIDEFDPTDPGFLNATNAAISNPMRSGNTFTFDVTADGDGVVSLDVPADVSFDEAGFGNTGSNTFSFTLSTGDPVASVSSSVVANDGVTSQSTVLFTAGFVGGAPPYTGFDATQATDVLTTNSTVDVGGLIDPLEFNILPNTEGVVSVQIPSDAITDQASNPNTASTVYEFTYDATRPSVVLSSSVINNDDVTSNTGALSFEAAFTDLTMIDTFDPTDSAFIDTTNATISNVMRTDNTFTFDVTANGDGDVTLSVPENVSFDEVGFGNTASNAISYTLDSTRPFVVLSSVGIADNALTNNAGPYSFEADFTDLTMIDAFDPTNASFLNVTNASISNVNRVDNSFTFDVTANGDGAVSLDIPENVSFDEAGLGNTASNSYGFTLSTVQPDATLASSVVADDGFTSQSSVLFEAVFNGGISPYSGFDATQVSDLLISNSTVDVSGLVSPTEFRIEPVSEGLVSLQIQDGAILDQASNPNTASAVYEFTYDATAPTVALNSSDVSTGTLTNNPGPYAFILDVTDLTDIGNFDPTNPSQLQLVNATASFTSRSGNMFVFDVSAIGDGDIGVTVPIGAVVDAVGLPSQNSDGLIFTRDTQAPIVNSPLAIVGGSPTSTSPIQLLIGFDEVIASFTTDYLQVTNDAAVGTVTPTVMTDPSKMDNNFIIELTGMAGSGDIDVIVESGELTDLAGNAVAGPQPSITIQWLDTSSAEDWLILDYD